MTTPHQTEWEEKSVEELGGKLHLVLNKTVDGRLTVAEYSKVVKLISAMLRQTEALTRRAVIEEVIEELEHKVALPHFFPSMKEGFKEAISTIALKIPRSNSIQA